jgi:uncharacterized oxidoreductase
MKLKDKTILITGGSSGIGLEAIQHFLNEGMKVIICGRNTEKNNLVRQNYKDVVVIECDITDENEVYLLHQLVSSIGGIDILYNNAAVINMFDLVSNNQSAFKYAENEINTNYLAAIRLNSYFMDMLQQRKEAAIIHTTSAVTYVPISFISTYSSSKAALQSYSISLREQLKKAKSRVKVFELIPPTVDTAVTKNFKGQKISTVTVVKALIKGLKNDTFTIRVSVVKMLYYINRFLPSVAYGMLNK